jgi:hypothetical protein
VRDGKSGRRGPYRQASPRRPDNRSALRPAWGRSACSVYPVDSTCGAIARLSTGQVRASEPDQKPNNSGQSVACLPFVARFGQPHVSPTAARNAVLPIFSGHIARSNQIKIPKVRRSETPRQALPLSLRIADVPGLHAFRARALGKRPDASARRPSRAPPSSRVEGEVAAGGPRRPVDARELSCERPSRRRWRATCGRPCRATREARHPLGVRSGFEGRDDVTIRCMGPADIGGSRWSRVRCR